MILPTEPIGSIPRPPALVEALQDFKGGRIDKARLDEVGAQAVRDTVAELEATGSPVITDGEQTKPSFATYAIDGLPSLAPDGVGIPFADGHERRLPRLTAGPFRYARHAVEYLNAAAPLARVPIKQAVISASALSLLYPDDGIAGYSQEAFLEDLVAEAVADIRGCLVAGAHCVQMDFTEARLSVKLDPSKWLLGQFVTLNNHVLSQFTAEEKQRIGVHTCPGGDQDSTHSADVDYADLLPSLFELEAGSFYIQLASEADPRRVLRMVSERSRNGQRVFVGVTDPIARRIETPEEVRDRVLRASEFIPPARLGTTDDCGFAPFADDLSTSRATAFAKIRARVLGTEMASRELGL